MAAGGIMAKDISGPCKKCGRKSPAHNGWTNYETWLVALWIENDHGSYTYWQERAESALHYSRATTNPTFTREERATLDIKDELKDNITDEAPDLGASMFADMLNAAFAQVNWYQIAGHMIEDAKQEA